MLGVNSALMAYEPERGGREVVFESEEDNQ